MIDKQQVYRHFNRHAHEYDKYAEVQRMMASRLTDFLIKMFVPRPSSKIRLLEIGCGTGLLTEQLVRHFPHAQIVALDLCEEMVELTRRRLAEKKDNIEFIVADAEDWQPGYASFDLIVSNATFQWFNETARTISKYMALLKPNGLFMYSTFLPGTFAELHHCAQQAARIEGVPEHRFGQTFVSEAEWRAMLAPQEMEYFRETHLYEYPTVRHFFDSIKRVGAGNALQERVGNGYLGKALAKRLVAEYERLYRTSNGGTVQATYEVGYFWIKGQTH